MELTDVQFKESVFDYETAAFKGAKPTVVDLYTDWCASCKALSPTLDKLAQKFEGKVDIMKVNITKADKLTEALEITGVPTILFFHPGEAKPRNILVGSSAGKIEENIQLIL